MSRNDETLNSGFKVIENDTVRKLWYGFLFVFHRNYGCIFSRFDTIHERDMNVPLYLHDIMTLYKIYYCYIRTPMQTDTTRFHSRAYNASCGKKLD